MVHPKNKKYRLWRGFPYRVLVQKASALKTLFVDSFWAGPNSPF